MSVKQVETCQCLQRWALASNCHAKLCPAPARWPGPNAIPGAHLLPVACHPKLGPLLLQNWGLLELPTGRGQEHVLKVFYTILPCLTVFAYNSRTPLGADFRSARCLSPTYSKLVQKETGLDMHDVRISGHPVVSQRQDDNQPSELLFLVHHSWRQHGGAAHWVVLVDVKTWQVGTMVISYRCMGALARGASALRCMQPAPAPSTRCLP